MFAFFSVLTKGTEILIIADDDSTIEFRKSPVMTPTERDLELQRLETKQEKILLLGWSPKARIILSEYSEYVSEGSKATVVLHEPSAEIRAAVQDVIEQCKEDLAIELVELNAFDREQLISLKPFDYNDIMVLPQKLGADKDAKRIDTETIVLLLLLRGLKEQLKRDGQTVTTKIVTEVLDSKNHSLIHQAGVDDFIISNRMVSMIFAQMSEEPDIKIVYNDLFEEDGSEIYVKPARLYFDELPTKVSFGDMMLLRKSAKRKLALASRSRPSEITQMRITV